MNEKIIVEYKIPETEKISDCKNLYECRSEIKKVSSVIKPFNSKVTVMLQAYNRIEKTKVCIENILKHTTGVDYDLLLIDNGSDDDTFEYFKSVPYDKVRVIRIDRNITPSFTWNFIDLKNISDYIVILANDIIVTPNWLNNLLKVIESDEKIGLVNPVSSNVSNLQEVKLDYSDIDEMQKAAEKFNISDPKKWHERLRMITLGSLIRKECLYTVGLPIVDLGFFHDFADDDISFKIRRAGYKLILAGDTWIHHNHDFRHLENKNYDDYQKSLTSGKINFTEKYRGVDAWDDVCNYNWQITNAIEKPVDPKDCSILGIDVKCGTPILEIKNKLRSFGIFDANCCSVTSEGKYYLDLQTVCGSDNVVVCQPDNLSSIFDSASFDYIIIENNINEYPEPFKIIKSAYTLLKKGGQMFVYLKNTYDIYSFLNVIGFSHIMPTAVSYNISAEKFAEFLESFNIPANLIDCIPYDSIPDDYVKEVNNRAGFFVKENINITQTKLTCDRFLFKISK